MNIAFIIPAAGRSTRFGGDKLSQDLGGRPLLLRTIEVLARRPEVRTIIIAGPADETDLTAFRDRYGPALGFHGARIVAGGKDHRWQSVRHALSAIDDPDITHIAIHDAARPALGAALLDRLFEAARTFPAVIPAIPITATVKRISSTSHTLPGTADDMLADAILGAVGRITIAARTVEQTIDRTNLVAVQTPQIFTADLLRRAYARTDLTGATDDSMLVERLGEPVHIIEGDPLNFKVTTPGDLTLIRAIMTC